MVKRIDANRAVEEYNAFVAMLPEFTRIYRVAIARGIYGSGILLSGPSKTTRKDGSPFPDESYESQTQMPGYSDPTGEAGIRTEYFDDVSRDAQSIIDNITHAYNSALRIISVVPATVVERMERNIPICTACNNPVLSRLHYGRWCESCRKKFKRWCESTGHRPDEKLIYEQEMKRLRESSGVAKPKSDFSFDNIEELQEHKELPTKRKKT